MSFASDVKKELTQLEVHPQHAKAELAALVRLNGELQETSQEDLLSIKTENAAIARRIYTLTKMHLEIQPEVSVLKKMKLKKNNVYTIKFRTQTHQILRRLDILESLINDQGISDQFMNDEQKARSYLRGAFLARGSVNSPDTSRYHLEIQSNDKKHHHDLFEMMSKFGLNPKGHHRKSGGYIVYLKESEKIADFLGLIGARVSLFKFEDTRIVRDMRNSVNRLVNCENANMNKTISAATSQIEDIELIIRTQGMDSLTPSLQEIAKTRLDHPDASLKELGELVPNGPITKSAANHRMRKISQKANQLRAIG